MKTDWKPGDRIWFAEEKRPYRVRACGGGYLICTKPFNPRHTYQYTIVDLNAGIRGADNYWKWGGYFNYGDDAECRKAVGALLSGEIEISHRNVVKLNITNKS